jgi:hypothetical protein
MFSMRCPFRRIISTFAAELQGCIRLALSPGIGKKMLFVKQLFGIIDAAVMTNHGREVE